MNEWCGIRLAAIRHTHDQRKFRHVQTNEEKDSSDLYNPYIPSNVEIVQNILNNSDLKLYIRIYVRTSKYNAWIINFIFKHRASHLSKYRTIYQIKYIPYTSTLMVKICLIMKLGYRWYIPLLQNITWNWAWELNNITCLLFYFTRFYNPKQISWRPNFSAILREITKVNSFYMVGITLHRELNNITYLLFYFTRYIFLYEY